MRVISFEKKLQIISEFEDEMNFDLSRDAFVFEDTELQNTVILEYRKNVVILTVFSLCFYSFRVHFNFSFIVLECG